MTRLERWAFIFAVWLCVAMLAVAFFGGMAAGQEQSFEIKVCPGSTCDLPLVIPRVVDIPWSSPYSIGEEKQISAWARSCWENGGLWHDNIGGVYSMDAFEKAFAPKDLIDESSQKSIPNGRVIKAPGTPGYLRFHEHLGGVHHWHLIPDR